MAQPPLKRRRVGKQHEADTSDSGSSPSPPLRHAFPSINIWGTAQIHQGDQYGTVSEQQYSSHPRTNTASSHDEPFARPSRLAVRKASNPTHRRDFLDLVYNALFKSLTFDRMDARHMNVASAMPRTCKWLFEHDDFIAWTDKDQRVVHHGFLWIKGKPGSGKSTIMKEAMRWVKRNESQLVISFFFNARGSHQLEKSTLGLYRSLVYQLLQDSSRSSRLRDSFARHFYSKYRSGTVEDWSINELQDFIVHVAKDCRERSLTIFIDALDECDEKEIRDMVSFLEDLTSHATSSGMDLKVCLSSRHYPHISIRHGLPLIVEQQIGHQHDLIAYIQGKLVAANTTGMIQLRQDLCEKAAGIFLWVVLVIPILNEIYDHGGTLMDMKQYLRTIPGELKGLFTNIINRHVSDKAEFSVLIKWILYSSRPLNPIELHLALQCSDNDATVCFVAGEVPEADALVRRILNASRGLTEVTKADPPVVQFIHETVRDFFFQHEFSKDLESSGVTAVVGQIHDEMKVCCLRYLNSSWELDKFASCQEVERQLPFLRYAVNSLFCHAALAQEHGVSQRNFLVQACHCGCRGSVQGSHAGKLHFSKWKGHSNSFGGCEQYTLNTTLLGVLSEKGLLPLIVCMCPPSSSINELAGWYGNAFFAACAWGHVALVEHFLANGADVNAIQGSHDHAFLIAVYHEHYPVVDLLLKQNLSIPQKSSKVCLHAMIAQSKLRCLQAVIHAGVDVNYREDYDDSILLLAVNTGNWWIVKCLVDAGANLNDDGEFLITSCLERGCLDIATMLIDAGAPSSLCHAVSIGDIGLMERFLSEGVELVDDRYNALAKAVAVGRKDIVQLLVTKNLYSNKIDKIISALYTAVKQGDIQTAQMLFEYGARVIGVRMWHKTFPNEHNDDTNALSLAMNDSENSIVKMLLHNGADFNVSADSHHWRTPLDEVCVTGDVSVARMLIDNGADLSGPKRAFDKPLLIEAITNDHDELACCFIEKGVNVSICTSIDGTALSLALRKATCPKAIKMLEEMGAPNIAPWAADKVAFHSDSIDWVLRLRESEDTIHEQCLTP